MYFLFVLLLIAPFNTVKSQVIMNGICGDTSVRYIKIVKFSPLWHDYNDEILTAKKVSPETHSQIDLKFSINNPEIVSLLILGKTWDIYVSPGDSLYFRIFKNNGQDIIRFSGRYPGQYNFYPALGEEIGNPFILPNYRKYTTLSDFKKVIDRWYFVRDSFISQYVIQNPVSTTFAQYIRSEIQYKYMYLLYSPLIEKSTNDGEMAKVPVDYFNLINSFLFYHKSGEVLLHVSNYALLALTYKYILAFSNNPWKNFRSTYENIVNNFTGKTREYLLTNLIGIYAKKQLSDYKSPLLTAFKSVPKYIADSICLAYISACKDDYLKINRPFPTAVLRNTYLIPWGKNKKMSLESVLKHYPEKAIYIDFWASWCGACLFDIQHSTEAEDFLKNKSVVYIYISLDTRGNEYKWRREAIKNNIVQNQFLLYNNFLSPLSKFLNIDFLPRYIILGGDHNIKNTNSARPTQYQIEQLKFDIIKATEKVYHY